MAPPFSGLDNDARDASGCEPFWAKPSGATATWTRPGKGSLGVQKGGDLLVEVKAVCRRSSRLKEDVKLIPCEAKDFLLLFRPLRDLRDDVGREQVDRRGLERCQDVRDGWRSKEVPASETFGGPVPLQIQSEQTTLPSHEMGDVVKELHNFGVLEALGDIFKQDTPWPGEEHKFENAKK